MKISNEQTINAYDQKVDEYVEGSPQIVDGDLKIWLDNVFGRIKKDAKILEIGSGTGKDADYLESCGFSIERTDASKGFIEYQKNKGKKIKYFDVLHDNYKGTYDVIFADAVFLHFDEKELGLILEKSRVALNKDGVIVFTLKQGEGEESTDRKLGAERYFRYWEKSSITSMLNDLNYKEINVLEIEDYRKDRPGWLLIDAKKGES